MKEPEKAAASTNPFAKEIIDEEAAQPLLTQTDRSLQQSFKTFDILSLRKEVADQEVLDEYALLELENNPEYMVMQSIGNAVLAVIIVLGAYWFVISAGDRVTPLCKPYAQPHLPVWSFKEEKLRENLCYTSTYCFWTYPILCPLAVIWVNWKNLVDKRIFYECLLNRIFLMQSRVSYLTSKTFWFLIIYGVLALSSVLYMQVGQNETLASSPYWRYKEVVFGLLAYFSAIGAFLLKLFSQWSVNAQIISITNYVYRDSGAALDLMNKCTFVSCEDFEASWDRVEELFEAMESERMIPSMSTPELLQLTYQQHIKWKEYEPTYMERARNFCGNCFVPKRYWVSRLLYFEHLKDTRSWHFRFCIRFYAAFMAISVALFCWGMFYTTSHYLLFQYKDMMPRDLRKLPPPHQAPAVYDRAARLIPKVADTVRDHALTKGHALAKDYHALFFRGSQ